MEDIAEERVMEEMGGGGGDERCEGMGIIIEGEDRKGSIAGEKGRGVEVGWGK